MGEQLNAALAELEQELASHVGGHPYSDGMLRHAAAERLEAAIPLVRALAHLGDGYHHAICWAPRSHHFAHDWVDCPVLNSLAEAQQVIEGFVRAVKMMGKDEDDES